jgi:hypothetical protein
MRDLLFSELIIFVDKIILEKIRIIIQTVKNTLKAPKIQEKFLETLWNMRKPNKVFKAHDKII